ncbi:hypothetical protein F4604DRAFT_1689528 [Suillus subluteus]|nr:hypothetical protein F4604DRAFT_1689528 [Suillus subluteus]
MPPRKKPRRSSPSLDAPAQRSSRPNCGVGSHAVQLRRAGETVAVPPTRKGPKGDNLQISSSEENPMAPSQVQKGKKNPPAKPHSTSKKNPNERRMTESSKHSQAPPSCLNPYVAHSSERFGFKESQPNGHKTVGQNMGQRDVGHERESTEHDGGGEKDRQNMDDYRESAPNSHEHNTPDDNADRGDDFDSNTEMFMMFSSVIMQRTGSEKTPSPTYLSKGKEVLDTVLWIYHEKKITLERGIFSLLHHLPFSPLFARLLSGVRHADVPAGLCNAKEEAQWQVTAAAAKLLKSGDYLRLPDSSGRIFKNFTVQALKDACLKFYYSNSKKALKNTDEFHRTIPINAMLLIAAVLKGIISGFCDTGTDKVPELTAEQCRTHFVNLWKSVDTLLDIPEHREELEEMLEQWARIGMGDFNECAAGSAMGSDMEDVNIIL